VPLDVLLYSDSGGGGGAERWLVVVARHLRRAGYRVAAAHPHDGPGLAQRLGAIEVASIPRSFERLAEDGMRAPGLVDLREPSSIIGAARPRLVIFSDATPAANIAAKEAAYAANVPYISVSHLGGLHPAIELALLRPRLRDVYERAERIIGVSSHTVAQLRAFAGSPLPGATVVFNGVEDEFFAAHDNRLATRSALGVDPGCILGVSVGRVDSHKGFAILTNALARIADTDSLTWLWAGGGPGLSRAKAVAALSPGRLRLLGERLDVASLLGAADLFALPTYRDSFSLATVEAMAAGLPVAVSCVDGVPEITADAAHLLPDPNDDAEATTEELAEVIARWMNDPDGRAMLGQRARTRADALFRESRMGGDYIDLVRSCIGPADPHR
jgi:glycosyltransferase involved in cell wall biosynthesis